MLTRPAAVAAPPPRPRGLPCWSAKSDARCWGVRRWNPNVTLGTNAGRLAGQHDRQSGHGVDSPQREPGSRHRRPVRRLRRGRNSPAAAGPPRPHPRPGQGSDQSAALHFHKSQASGPVQGAKQTVSEDPRVTTSNRERRWEFPGQNPMIGKSQATCQGRSRWRRSSHRARAARRSGHAVDFWLRQRPAGDENGSRWSATGTSS